MNKVKKYFKKHGYLLLLGVAVGLALLVFAALYGERLNPFDGKSWSDFNQGSKMPPAEKNILYFDNAGCVVKGPDGQRMTIEGKTGKMLFPKGSTITSECFESK